MLQRPAGELGAEGGEISGPSDIDPPPSPRPTSLPTPPTVVEEDSTEADSRQCGEERIQISEDKEEETAPVIPDVTSEDSSSSSTSTTTTTTTSTTTSSTTNSAPSPPDPLPALSDHPSPAEQELEQDNAEEEDCVEVIHSTVSSPTTVSPNSTISSQSPLVVNGDSHDDVVVTPIINNKNSVNTRSLGDDKNNDVPAENSKRKRLNHRGRTRGGKKGKYEDKDEEDKEKKKKKKKKKKKEESEEEEEQELSFPVRDEEEERICSAGEPKMTLTTTFSCCEMEDPNGSDIVRPVQYQTLSEYLQHINADRCRYYVLKAKVITNDLGLKEAQISDLNEEVESLERELKEAKEDLARYQKHSRDRDAEFNRRLDEANKEILRLRVVNDRERTQYRTDLDRMEKQNTITVQNMAKEILKKKRRQ